jgi:SAM-dependent methyltransferase
MARFIVREARYKPLRGSLLVVGRQTVSLSPEAFKAMLRDEGFSDQVKVEIDTTTRSGYGREFVTDASFFRALGADSVVAIDASDYEGAEIVHDLNRAIPAELEMKFDFIFNGSVLDNLFDPAAALRNISKMMTPNGRVIHFEHASNATNNAYLQFSPNWFYDYYAANRFADCKTYLAFFSDLNGPWAFYACRHSNGTEPIQFRSSRFGMTCVVAEKSPSSTCDRSPMQGQYRSGDQIDDAKTGELLFHQSRRPLIAGKSFSPHIPTLAEIKSRVPVSLFAKGRGYAWCGWI